MVILPGIAAAHGQNIHRKNCYSVRNYQLRDEESSGEWDSAVNSLLMGADL
jgi:hypothetical protein